MFDIKSFISSRAFIVYWDWKIKSIINYLLLTINIGTNYNLILK